MMNLESTLEGLFPPVVHVAIESITERSTATVAELIVLGEVVEKRKIEFSAGRTAARRAMSGMNVPHVDILVGEHREPLPPAGVVLSISHDQSEALAVAGSDGQWLGLGVDIASADELSEDLLDMICRPGDLLNLGPAETPLQRAKLVFCLKEALFKAIFPQVGDWIEFKQSELSIDLSRGEFDAVLFNLDGSEIRLEGLFSGRFTQIGERWVAGASLRR